MSKKKAISVLPAAPSLAAFARLRLRGPHPLVAQNRRLMSVTPAVYKKLVATAKALSTELGFMVFPMQVAALMVERGA